MSVRPVKLSIPEEMFKLLEARAKRVGLPLTTFCTTLIFNYAIKEADKE